MDDAGEDPDFDPGVTDANHASLVSDIENKIIAKLDREPTQEELVSISIEANKIASTMDVDTSSTDDNLPRQSSVDSEDIKSPVSSRLKPIFPDSDDEDGSDAMDTETKRRSKRLALTPSDDTSDSGNHFRAEASTPPKKKSNATGGRSPSVPD